MRVFITGASGQVGGTTTDELVANGHSVNGLARSDASASKIEKKGATAIRGDIDNLDLLKKQAQDCDAFIHCAFNHDDFTKFVETCNQERDIVQAIGELSIKSKKPVIVSSGTLFVSNLGRTALESDQSSGQNMLNPRAQTQQAIDQLVAQGADIRVIRLCPTVHSSNDHGMITMLGNESKSKGFVPYLEGGKNSWPAVHLKDVATLYRLVLEHGQAGGMYHAVAEESVNLKTVAEAIGEKLGLPVQGATLEELQGFGFVGMPWAMDNPTSSKLTREQLGWTPTQIGLIDDIRQNYFK